MRYEFYLPLTFACQAGEATILVGLTLLLKYAGMATLITWARTRLKQIRKYYDC